jgi:hypothetical protein
MDHGYRSQKFGSGSAMIVATPADNGDIVFGWFSFLRAERRPYPEEPDEGRECRVLYGNPVKSERLPKSIARTTKPYSVFFTVAGNFKRWKIKSF